MFAEDAKKRIEELYGLIEYHNNKYYVEDDPELEDFEYDALNSELKKLETEFPEYKRENSPTAKVGGMALAQFEPVAHTVRMESLQDVFSLVDVDAFVERITAFSDNAEFSVEPKIDGLSVSLEYDNGKFIIGSTRGDGDVGENVTANLMTIKSIPKTIDFKGRLEVRGEVYMPHESFLKLRAYQELNDEKPAKNPRNAAAGSLRQKNSEITAKRELEVFIFNIQQIEGKEFSSHIESLEFLKAQGFSVLPFYYKCKFADQIKNCINEIGEMRGNLQFDIDGAVVKTDNLDLRSQIGSTSKFPKWAVAFKYPPEEKETVLLDIEINVGRTGALTPTAVFEPITLAGTTVSRAVLHNQDFINEKAIGIGDTIIVRKAGDIIPEVVAKAKNGENHMVFKLPSVCPVCNSHVHKDEGEAVVRCVNMSCPAQQLRNLIHFCSRPAMDIEGFGEAVLEQLVEAKLISSPIDLYSLKKDDIVKLERFGEKSADNMLAAVEKSKQNDLYRLIFGFGIHHIGQKAAKLLCDAFGDMDSILNATIDDVLKIDGFGNIMAQSLMDFLSNPQNIQLINRFKEIGMNMRCLTKVKDARFAGLTFVLTGKLPTYERDDAAKIIESFGGKTSSSVSKKTYCVLVGEDAGSKLTKAQQLGIKIIDEAEFNEMIK